MVAFCFAPGVFAGAPIHYVSPSGTHQWPYTNWVEAATNIQQAVDAAVSGDVVFVTNGTYYVSPQLVITQDVTIVSVNGATSTILDGMLTNRVVLIAASNAIFDGFTVTNGIATGGYGGGVWIGAGNSLMDCAIAGCAAFGGGGVYATLSAISNCTFTANVAERFGGGLYCEGAYVQACTFVSNSAELVGGGMMVTMNGPCPAMRDCTFDGNFASAAGGACCGSLTNVSAVMTNVVPGLLGLTNIVGQLDSLKQTLTNMFPQLPQELGALLRAGTSAARPRVRASTVSATDNRPSGVIWHCVMVSNTADYGGGMLLVDTEDLIVSNCQFRENKAQIGGGVFSVNGGEFCNTTLAGNDATFLGGGVLMLDAGALENCSVVSNHAAVAGGGAMLAVTTVSVTTNIVTPLGLSTSGADLPRVRGSDFFGNSAGTMGGGLVLGGGGIAKSNSISRNCAVWGGGVASWGGCVRETAVISNSALFGGGVFAITGGCVSNCTLQGNSADWIGGGVIAVAASGSLTMRDCLVSDNLALAGGGMGLLLTADVQACSITSNTAARVGGGVLCLSGGDLQSSLVTRNAAGDGGGVYCLGGGRLINDTITDNVASNTGGGLCVATNVPGGLPSSQRAIVQNTILYGNAAAIGVNFRNLVTNVTYSYCCAYPAPETGGEGNITNNPGLTPSCHLRSASPCIDAGTASNAPPTDIDGETRWDDPRHSNFVSIVDIGADEFVDVDLDNMADYWETTCFGGITNRNGTSDADNDALNDFAEYENSTSPTNSDTDADQMPDGWEVTHALNPLIGDANADPDSDGVRNLDEYVSDTDPHNGDSVLSLIRVERQLGGIRLDWKGGREAYQILECREDLASTTEQWTAIFALPRPTALTNAVIDMGATHRTLFYRIRAER